MRKSKSFWLMAGLVIVLFLIAVFAPLLAPNDPNATNLMAVEIGPCRQYPLGTDALGRCMLSRVLYGARTSIFSSLLITLIVFLLGVFIGVLSGYFGGWVDVVLNKIVTIVQAFPKFVLAIAISGLLGVGIRYTILALCFVEWTDYARMARSFTFQEKERTYLKAARVCGESHFSILVRRLIPNIIPPLIVNASLGISTIIAEIAGLSYLGVGVKEPMAEWGSMINAGRLYMQTDVCLVLIPGLAIFVTAVIFNLFGEKLRDRFDVG